MNAAARLVYEGLSPRQVVLAFFFTRKQVAMLAVMGAVLLSALSLIYVTHTTRELHANYQARLNEEHRLQVEYGQLLLERGSWTTQARVQHIAEKKLEMIFPEIKSVVIIHE